MKIAFLKIAASNFHTLEHANLRTAISPIATGWLPAQQILIMKIATWILFTMSCLSGAAIRSHTIVTMIIRQTSTSKWQLHNNHEPRGNLMWSFYGLTLMLNFLSLVILIKAYGI